MIIRAISVLAFATLLIAAPQFVVNPALSKDGSGNYWVSFTLSESTDVAVSIVHGATSLPVRHLAAGVLGSNAPLPLVAGTLTQSIKWDGKDDAGISVADTVPLLVRVRAGMKVRLVNMVGDNPDIYYTDISGVTADESNNLYITGLSNKLRRNGGQGCVTLRAFDSTGRYIKTIYPYSAELPKDSVRAHGIVELSGSSYAPKIASVEIPILSSSLLPKIGVTIIASPVQGELITFRNGSFQVIRTSGGLDPSSTIKNFTPSAYSYCLGTDFVSTAANPRYLYFSGRFRGANAGWQQLVPNDTSYWRDGQVFKIDKMTGVVVPWLRMDTIPLTAAERDTFIGKDVAYSIFHGTSVDDSGHVFVCDRYKKRIGVYDTLANLVGSIPIKYADDVYFHKKTGALYVTTRWRNTINPDPKIDNEGAVWLYKFSDWRISTTPVCSVKIHNVLNRYGSRTYIATTKVNGKPVVWVGYSMYGIKGFVDDGNNFTTLKNFPSDPAYGFGHLEVDRKSETAFFTDNSANFYKINDWNNPSVVVCSTSFKKPLLAVDMVVSPDGYLYAKTSTAVNGYGGPFRRLTLDYYHASAPFANTGKDTCIRSIVSRYDALTGEKGFAVSYQGKVGSIYFRDGGRTKYYAMEFNATGGQDTSSGIEIAGTLTSQVGGIRYDKEGNVYLGFKTYAPDRMTELPYILDRSYLAGVGSVVKYPVGQYGFKTTYTSGIAATPGALKVYPADLAPLPGGSGDCACTTPRFDVDPFGRLFIPSSITHKVTVLDNNGNKIIQFGQYGNRDSRGGLPGGTVNTPSIPFAWPASAVASEDHIFVSDVINCRIIRLKMDYELDNMPGVEVEQKMVQTAVFETALDAFPNPFNPVSHIRVTLSKSMHVNLSVYNASGRLVRTIHSGAGNAGNNQFMWDGANSNGVPAASGLYFIRLTAGSKILNKSVVLTR